MKGYGDIAVFHNADLHGASHFFQSLTLNWGSSQRVSPKLTVRT